MSALGTRLTVSVSALGLVALLAACSSAPVAEVVIPNPAAGETLTDVPLDPPSAEPNSVDQAALDAVCADIPVGSESTEHATPTAIEPSAFADPMLIDTIEDTLGVQFACVLEASGHGPDIDVSQMAVFVNEAFAAAGVGDLPSIGEYTPKGHAEGITSYFEKVDAPGCTVQVY